MMAPKKNMINFNAFWPFIKELAHRVKDMDKGALCKASGISPSRYIEFDKGKPISAYYFLKFLGGLKVKLEDVERLSGTCFSKAQKDELNFYKGVEVNRKVFEALLRDPQRLDDLRKELDIDN